MILLKKLHRTKQIAYKLSHHEVACKCTSQTCQITIISDKLLRSWNKLRKEIALSIYPTSAFRCFFHNKTIGGAEQSHHMAGEAIDVARENLTHQAGVRLRSDAEFEEIAKKCGFTKIIFYNGFIHLDVRETLSLEA